MAPQAHPLITNPAIPKKIQRALTAINLTCPSKFLQATDALYTAYWGPPRNEGRVDALEGREKVLVGVLGEEVAREVAEKTTSDEVKKLLNARTKEAIDAGAFGIPYILATNAKGETEPYWGFDHLGQVLEHLCLVPGEGEKGWRAML